MGQAPGVRRGWWRVWPPALLFCFLVATAGQADAGQRAAPASAWPEVLTLEEAARFLRVGPAVLVQLADWRQVPARRIAGYWRFSRAALLAWLAGDWREYGAAVPPPPGARMLPSAAMARVSGMGTTLAQAKETSPPPARTDEPEPIGEAPEERTAEEVFLRGRRVLLAPGEVTLDLGLFYSRRKIGVRSCILRSRLPAAP